MRGGAGRFVWVGGRPAHDRNIFRAMLGQVFLTCSFGRAGFCMHLLERQGRAKHRAQACLVHRVGFWGKLEAQDLEVRKRARQEWYTSVVVHRLACQTIGHILTGVKMRHNEGRPDRQWKGSIGSKARSLERREDPKVQDWATTCVPSSCSSALRRLVLPPASLPFSLFLVFLSFRTRSPLGSFVVSNVAMQGKNCSLVIPSLFSTYP